MRGSYQPNMQTLAEIESQPDFWQQALVGALIIAAIVFDRVLSARQARKLVEARDES